MTDDTGDREVVLDFSPHLFLGPTLLSRMYGLSRMFECKRCYCTFNAFEVSANEMLFWLLNKTVMSREEFSDTALL